MRQVFFQAEEPTRAFPAEVAAGVGVPAPARAFLLLLAQAQKAAAGSAA